MKNAFSLRNILVGLLAIAVIGGGVGYFLHGQAGRNLLRELNLTLQEVNGRAQVRRVLAVNQKSLKDLVRIDLAASLRPDDITNLLPYIISVANSSEDFQKQKINIRKGAITTGIQRLSATVDLTKVFPDLEVDMTATANVAVAAAQDAIVFELYFDRIEVTKVLITSERFDARVVTPTISSGIKELLGVINVVFDREINKKKTMAALLKIPPLTSGNLKESNSKSLQFQDREISIYATMTQSAVLVGPEGMMVMAAVENKKPESSVVPKLDDPTSMTEDEVSKAVSGYQNGFLEKYKASFGDDAPDHTKASFLLIQRAYLARTLNEALKPPAICAKGNIAEQQPPFNAPIALPALGKRRCDDIINACRFKDLCTDAKACTETVQKEFDDTCKIGETVENIFNPLGVLIDKKTHDKYGPCKVWRPVEQALQTPACVAFGQTKAINPLICDSASNIVKAKCDVIVAADKAFCQAEQGLRDFIVSNPVAVVSGDIKPNVAVDACLSNPMIESNFNSFGVTIDGRASGPLSVHLAFENKTPPGVGLCKADWAEDFDFQASTNVPGTHISFAVTSERDGEKLNMIFKGGDQELKLDFSPAPIDVLFVRHPQLLVNCSPVAALAATYVAYDTVVNEQAKNWSPLLSGKGYKQTVKDVTFKISIPKLEVKDMKNVVLLALQPNWLSKALAFVK